MALRRFAALLVLLAASSLSADPPGVYAITGGTVHPVSGPDIANGIVIVRDGLVEAVGANVPIPADATTIDAKGMHVYPGLIDAQTSLGFKAVKSDDDDDDDAKRPPEPTPDSLALRSTKISDDDADAKRATGVTTIVTAPSFGIFNGQSAILNLGEGSIDSRVIKSPAAMQISFAPRPTWTYPDSLMGVMSFLRQSFLDAQQNAAARAIYDKNPAGLKRPDESAAADALARVIRRDVPVVFIADSDAMMRRAQTLAHEFDLRFVISGARQAYRMPDELKSVPVLVSVKWPVAPSSKEDREDQPLRIIRDRQLAPTTPSVLVKSGVSFALVSGAGKAGDFLPGIRKAIENGLSADDALRATTLWPARIFGVDRQLGSLDRGKIANVVISDKPIFEKDAKVKRVLVDGREIRLPADDKKPAESGASTIDGTWSLTVRLSEATAAIRVTLHNEDGKLTGTYSGDRGSGDIRNGRFEGSTVDFTIAAVAQGAETSDWIFHGTLKDGALEGTVATNTGSAQFSGSKEP